MRIFSIVPADANSEAGLPPDPRVMEEMGRLGAEGIASGVLLDQGGLAPSRYGAKVTFTAGKAHVTDGPFAETKELIAGYAILNVKDLDQGIAEAKKLPLRCQVELRPIFDVEDFTPEVKTKLAGEQAFRAPARRPGTQRFMLVFKAGVESTEPPSLEIIEAMSKYNNALIAAGALLQGEGLQPSVAGARVDLATGEVQRGPFDAKGLVTGWWLIQVATKNEAIEWASRVPIPDGVIEVRPIFDNPSCAHSDQSRAAS